MPVTLSQARYLIAMYRMRDRERSMSKVALTLGVSKPSVTNMIHLFVEKGMVKKGNNFQIALTSYGRNITEEILQKHQVIKNYFVKDLAIPKAQADEDALKLMFELSEESVKSFILKIEMETARRIIESAGEEQNLSSLSGIRKDGVYEPEFLLLRKNDSGISMGNKGLMHPAKLTIVGGKGVLRLRAVPISHKAMLGDVLRGRLARFFYWNGQHYVEVEEQDDVYSFPLVGMTWERDDARQRDYGLVRIKVQASVGILNMPESEAMLAIYFE